jgi:uncharacterized membrane protein YdbT with pleckstrin-like domain
MKRERRLYPIAVSAMALSALAGIVLTLAFVSVRWPGATGRYLKVAFVTAVVVFLASCVIAILSAARDTYLASPRSTERDT